VIFEFIFSNIKWIFSGIGVFVISGLVWLARKKYSQHSTDSPSSIKMIIKGNKNIQMHNSKIIKRENK
jgi:hypothetical protein